MFFFPQNVKDLQIHFSVTLTGVLGHSSFDLWCKKNLKEYSINFRNGTFVHWYDKNCLLVTVRVAFSSSIYHLAVLEGKACSFLSASLACALGSEWHLSSSTQNLKMVHLLSLADLLRASARCAFSDWYLTCTNSLSLLHAWFGIDYFLAKGMSEVEQNWAELVLWEDIWSRLCPTMPRAWPSTGSDSPTRSWGVQAMGKRCGGGSN